ncbi:DUF5941 domain-containing protein [Streptomyces sp. NPDC047108]|uniref:DUF5941 domain-containing protein n=1 Tax=Streptomyces sp. NPDC047108 TaxID=3155025 RepID=UPI0033EED2E8
MSTAILTGQPVAGSQLESDLRSLGFDVVEAGADADLAGLVGSLPAAERVALVDPRTVAHTHALRLALTDPRFPAAAAPGVVTAQAEARPDLLRALAATASPAPATVPVDSAVPAAESAASERVSLAEPAAADSLPDRLSAALGAADVAVHRPELGVLVATVPAGEEERTAARAAVDAVDDEKVRLRTAVKARDGFFTTYCISPYSRYIARWCARRGLTPNQVTTASLLTALIAAGCAATGTRSGYVAAGVLLIASFVLDCADGQLARYSLQYSTLGAWLDATFDRAKEYAYYAGLAIGAARGGDDVWALALGAMVLQTVRHIVDFSFTEANHDATANTSPTASLSDRLDSVGWTVWLRRMIVLPIGERWAMIAVLTALTTPRIVFYALLVGCALAALYTTAGRVLRSLTRQAHRTDRAAEALRELADSGPLADLSSVAVLRGTRPSAYLAPVWAALGTVALLVVAFDPPFGAWSLPVVALLLYARCSGRALTHPLKGPLDWLVPPIFRVAEYGLVMIVAIRADVNGALPAAYGLVAAVAYHHYDTVYRIRGGTGAPPRLLVWAIGGHEGRVLAIAIVAAFLHGTAFTIALAALAAVLALAVLTESIRFWVSSRAPAVHDETGEPA